MQPQPVTGRWIVLGVLIALLTVVFIRLGFWQLDRREAVVERNDIVAGRLVGEPVPLGALLLADIDQEPEDLVGWPVVVEGTFLVDEEVLVRGRALDGTPGGWVVTPLATDDGLVVVNRGWVPLDVTAPGDPRVAPATGRVVVEGVTIPGEVPTRWGPQDPEGRLAVVGTLDLGRLGRHLGADLGPVVVQATAADPGGPTPLPLPGGEDPRTNTGYAIQWFGFAAVVVVGFIALVGRQLGRGPLARVGRRTAAG